MENNLPLDFLHWGLALLPLVLLLLMLVVFKWSGGTSGWIAMGVATLTKVARSPLQIASQLVGDELQGFDLYIQNKYGNL